jgi:hypothetical protein
MIVVRCVWCILSFRDLFEVTEKNITLFPFVMGVGKLREINEVRRFKIYKVICR